MTQESRIEFTRYDYNPGWNSLKISTRHEEWEISTASNETQEIEISCSNNDNVYSVLFLNQTELKQVIEFLQSKLVEK